MPPASGSSPAHPQGCRGCTGGPMDVGTHTRCELPPRHQHVTLVHKLPGTGSTLGCGLTAKFGVDCVREEGAATEVNKLDLSGGQVEDDVLGLDIPVQDTAAVAVPHSHQHLEENAPRQILGQEPPLSDEVKEVLRWLRTLQNEYEGVGQFKPIEELDDGTAAGAHLPEHGYLHGNNC
ncbi:uncharacterized protein ACIB01_013318 isoform 2-T2 [Guaruba guarouba]